MKVLVVDDSKAFRERLVWMLSTIEGVELVGAVENLTEGRAILARTEPDTLVLDIHLRRENGMDLLVEAKQNHPATKVIMLTNHTEPQYQRRCAELGADYFLSKSLDSQLFLEITRELATREAK